jgi:thiamine pyrophosphate-dependent acetolactate synthase large subunit-like protein
VHAGSDHAELAALAVKHALDARGVTHLVLPDEVQTQPSDAAAKTPQGRLAVRLAQPSQPEIARAAAMISASRRPVLIAGHGLIPDTHPLGAGVLGRSGTPVASWLMNEADLLIVVGASFANHTGIAPYKSILQIDDNAAAIGRFDPVGTGIVGDAALTLERCSRNWARPAPRTSARPWRPGGPSGERKRPGGPLTNEAVACPPRRSSTRCRGTCRTTLSSPSMSATTPTRWAGTWSPLASRS